MRQTVERIYHRFDCHTQELLRGATTAFVVKVLAAGISFSLNIVLARLLGAEGVGVYYLALTLATAAATFGRFGMSRPLVRFIASNAIVGDWSKVKGVYSKAILFATVCSSLLACLLYGFAPWLAGGVFSKPELSTTIRWISFAIVPFSLFILQAHALQGLKKILESMVVLSVLTPLLTILGCMLLVPYCGVNGAVWAFTLATVFTLFIGSLRWKANMADYRGLKGQFNTRELLQSSVPLFFAQVSTLIMSWSAIFFLGVWESSESVGIFTVVLRTANLISFILVAVNSMAAPKFAALYKQNDMRSIEKIVKNSSKIMMIMASPILFLFIMFPESILEFFGKEFISGSNILIIMALAQFFNIATGSVGFCLMMTGNEKIFRNILLFCAALNILLNILLIPLQGVLGATVATCVTVILQNSLATWYLKKKFGFLAIPVEIFRVNKIN